MGVSVRRTNVHPPAARHSCCSSSFLGQLRRLPYLSPQLRMCGPNWLLEGLQSTWGKQGKSRGRGRGAGAGAGQPPLSCSSEKRPPSKDFNSLLASRPPAPFMRVDACAGESPHISSRTIPFPARPPPPSPPPLRYPKANMGPVPHSSWQLGPDTMNTACFTHEKFSCIDAENPVSQLCRVKSFIRGCCPLAADC